MLSRAFQAVTILFFFFANLALVTAQKQTFQWSTTNISKSGLGECDTVGIQIQSLTSTNQFLGVVPPFFVISYELGGITNTEWLGDSYNQNWTWVVRHPQGAQIFVDVVDSLGNSGGVGATTVKAGSTSSCHASSPSSPVHVVASVPQVSTCDSVTANITGGTKPYTVSIMPSNGDIPTNFTLDAGDDMFTYVNRVQPGSSFLITAADSTGQWAWGTNLISSVGSSNTSCPGQQSFGSQSANSTSSSTTTKDKSSSNGHLSTAVIVGIAVGALVLLASVGLAIFFFMRRRRTFGGQPGIGQVSAFREDAPFISPGPASGNSMRSEYSFAASQESDAPLLENPHPLSPGASDTSGSMGRYLGPREGAGLVSPAFSSPGSYRHVRSASEGSYSPFAAVMSPAVSGSTSQEPPEASIGELAGNPEADSSFASASTGPSPAKLRLARAAESRRQQTVVQHQDAEDMVDVPPVYRDRTNA
ncbi:hypothetical protein SCHPADRAFT_146594 [Schizopora paradoxa]|uniref:Mid2 domain-containing protein n=1 Tax=Schizopora paradoxa TaxID=27342 RepID=A0A0H2S8F0_9AGAM|nr:hypothetical protein SCHPADRAFT_146594 [Schizopora paradoxa]